MDIIGLKILKRPVNSAENPAINGNEFSMFIHTFKSQFIKFFFFRLLSSRKMEAKTKVSAMILFLTLIPAGLSLPRDPLLTFRLAGKGIVAKNFTEKSTPAAGCTEVACLQQCNKDERCTATQFETANDLCTLFYCNEFEVTDKPGTISAITSILYLSSLFLVL